MDPRYPIGRFVWEKTALTPGAREDNLLAMDAWHVRHHVAHITPLRGRKGWDA